MGNPRSAVHTALLVQVALLGIWTAWHVAAMASNVSSARQGTFDNMAPVLVVSGVFGICLVAALATTVGVWARGIRSLNILLRLELGVAGLVIVAIFSNQGQANIVQIASFLLALGIFAVTLRTRLE